MNRTLTTDFSNLIKNPGDYDVKIIVGEGEKSKEFRAHSLVLSSRSTYFKSGLSTRWVRKDDNGIIIFNKPNISPLVFEVIIKYIYTGLLNVDKISLVDVIIAADELELLEALQQLEAILIKNKLAWQTGDFIKVCQLDHHHFVNLYNSALKLICNNPKMIFETEEYLKFEETFLINILKCDDLKLEEIEIWEYLIKWGIENTESILDGDMTKWTSTDFINLEKTIHNCIPHIRFFQMSPNDYSYVRTQFKDILPDGLDEEVLQYFLNPNFKNTFNILPSRCLINSKIINSADIALIASWIDKKRGTPYKFRDIPFKFKLIYRASQNGFRSFHSNCDNKGPTIVVIKVRPSGEIIGGYNPLEWRSSRIPEDNWDPILFQNYISFAYYNHRQESSDSFIFSLTNRRSPTLSRVTSKREAITWCRDKGPCFGLDDLVIYSLNNNVNDVVGYSKQHSYEKKIIIDEGFFEIKEYEVFEIIDDSYKSITFQFINRMFLSSTRMLKKVVRFIKLSLCVLLLVCSQRS